jgi:hypothetical protein
MPPRINWQGQLNDAFEGAVRQLGGLFAPNCTYKCVHIRICEILGHHQAERLGLHEGGVINRLRRARAEARFRARAPQPVGHPAGPPLVEAQPLEAQQRDAPVPDVDSADEAEDASATSDTPEVLPPSGEIDAHNTSPAATGVAAPDAVSAVWRVARLVACLAWSGALFVLVTSDRALAVAFEAAYALKMATRDFSATLVSAVDASTVACAATSETAEAAAIAVFAFAAFAAMHSCGTVGAASGRAAATCLVALGLILLRGEMHPERAICARALLPGATAARNGTGVP